MEVILNSGKNLRVSPKYIDNTKIGSSDGIDKLSKSATDSCQDSPRMRGS